MKRVFNVLFVLLLLGSVFSCKDNAVNRVKEENIEKAKIRDSKAEGLPEMTFESREFEFGTITQGEKVNAVFKFKNTGKSDLIITRAKASCGCTVPDWPKDKAIKPGETGEITAVFDSKTKRNKQNKSITLSTNTLKGREVIYIKGFVTPNPELDKKREAIRKNINNK